MAISASNSQIVFNTWGRGWKSLFAVRPAIYACLVSIAVFAAFAYQLRTRSIFACQADGYTADQYVAYCHGRNYGEYEHGAFAFDLEPLAENFAASADVLVLGSSRIQIALSTRETADWFSAALARYYLLGFSYFENVVFAENILQKIRPHAKVYVINVDDFFDRFETSPVKTIFHDPGARKQYETKRLWQRIHEPICKKFVMICGASFAIFRSRETGAYHEEGGPQTKMVPVSYDASVDQDVVDRNTSAAVAFLSRFTQQKCVILTMVPYVGTKIGNATAIATALGMELVTPSIPEVLQTFDGYHLDQPSASRWSQAFFQTAGPQIRSCLEKQGAAPSGSPPQSIAH
jgi:hypothetical protein